jgi:hypothetical protein
MNKIALADREPATLAQVTVADASSMISSAPPVGSVLEGGIFDDFALLGALVFGAGKPRAITRVTDARSIGGVRHRLEQFVPRNLSQAARVSGPNTLA